MPIYKPVSIKYATLKVEYVSSYGYTSITDVTIQNNTPVPRPYSLSVQFSYQGKIVDKKQVRGIIMGRKTRQIILESNVNCDKAYIKLSGLLGLRTFDAKVIYPS